jgi:hypothetical protein
MTNGKNMEEPSIDPQPKHLFGPEVTDILRIIVQEELVRKQCFKQDNIICSGEEEISLSFCNETLEELQILCKRFGLSPETLIIEMLRIINSPYSF